MEKISLNGLWSLRLDPEENGLAENWAKTPILAEYQVRVPGCVQQLEELGEAYVPHNDMCNGYKGTFFVEKTVSVPMLKAGERCRLYMGGVGPACHVWVNGQYAFKSIYGIGRIYEDITEFVQTGENRITLAVTEQYASLITGMRFSGMDWSGIYSEVYLEITGAVAFANTYIALKTDGAFAEGVLLNSGDAFDGEITVTVGGKSYVHRITAQTGEKTEFSVPVDGGNLPRWSYRTPNMVEVIFSCTDSHGNETVSKLMTGIRELAVKGDRIYINGLPTFFKGTGSEYFSPTISPLTDREILTSRYNAMKTYGFNFYRCHTHVPTEEEMCIADEMGMMLCVEFGLVSNFDKTTPIEEGLKMWKQFIRQTRQHPCVVVYCIGNEGSQLMVDSHIERNRAKAGYQIVKDNTVNQLGIIAFGMQGELPELPNDFETPHLWSENFLWSYDGLTDIPWEDLGRTTGGKPCVIHEYGKFGVWPSRKEEQENLRPGCIKPDHGTQSYNWLKKNSLEHLEETLVANSRKAANRFNRIILEDARRQNYVSGYALWTFFRRTQCNAGLSDDFGIHLNGETELFTKGCNAEVAILMNRGFQNRAFACQVEQKIGISLSNFSEYDRMGTLRVALTDGEQKIAATTVDCSIAVGRTEQKATFGFAVPVEYAGKKLQLQASFICNGETVSQNGWDLWAFDTSAREQKIFLHMEDITAFRAMKRLYPNAQRLSSVDSIIIGCRSWRDPKLAETARKSPETLIISDIYDEVIKTCIANGNKVLLLDTGKLPEEWMLPPICPDLGERDTGRFYTSFRAGWDKGNLVTLVERDALLGDYPQEGFCDLHFYDMMQSARILKPEVIESTFGKVKRVISSISKTPVVQSTQSIVQDPNAIKEQNNTNTVKFNAREQGYLLKISDKLAVCTLKLLDNPAGLGLMSQIVNAY